MTGKRIMYDKHCRVEFGTYVQTHEKHNNSMEPRTSGAIALRPSGNEQGGHYFLSLHTGKRILRNHWTILPMRNDVVDAVHRLAAASKQAGDITFTDKDGNIITGNDDEEIEEAMENEPFPVPNDHHENIINDDREEIDEEAITGVDEDKTVETYDITPPAQENQDEEITGVNKEQSIENTHDNTQPIPEEEKDPDEYVTIGDINITSEMNASNRETEIEQT